MFKRGIAGVGIAAVLVALALALALEVVAQTLHQSPPFAVAGTPSGTASAGASPTSAPVDKGSIRFQHLDLNHDGKLSREEAARSSFLSKHFDEIDTNHDGFITPDEKRAAWKVHARLKAAAASRAASAPPAPSQAAATPASLQSRTP